jgi:hypothetical protein
MRRWIGRWRGKVGLCRLPGQLRGARACRRVLSMRPATKSVEKMDLNESMRRTGCSRLPVCTFTDLNKTGVPIPNFSSTLPKSHTFNNGDLTLSSSPTVTNIPLLSTICVTLPLECAIQLLVGTKSRLRRWTEPWMSARRIPEEDCARVDISGVFYGNYNRRRAR